ncbi:LysR family transcriptional regulator [Streptomyces profundus]|uniref:LysR family transcriptional regulator n=1 Tax=Streptomyces profundus TaxID=2867410 RepID=UPI001D15FDA7|nr:LysR family transcriptional regulator [Streptomyces sp. MA3_2.13]UED84860.1 LysR family transcriptional regulator [Streptomyces sp. MA3_2.13]
MALVTDRDLSPGELRVLVAVERERGFSAAARELGLTQSAVSHAMRGIERKLGVVLFERGRGGARPTPAGERAVAHARRVLRLLDVLAREARGAETGAVSGPLRIAAFRSAALHLLPPALRLLAARHGEIEPRVRVVRDIGAGTPGEVAAGRADIAIATIGDRSPVPDGMVGGTLLREPYAMVSPAGHPDPRALPLVDWAENCSSYTRDWWDTQDWLPAPTVETEDDGGVLTLVRNGDGMAIMPALSLRDLPEGVQVTDLGPSRPSRAIGHVTTPELAASQAVRALIRALRDTTGPLSG